MKITENRLRRIIKNIINESMDSSDPNWKYSEDNPEYLKSLDDDTWDRSDVNHPYYDPEEDPNYSNWYDIANKLEMRGQLEGSASEAIQYLSGDDNYYDQVWVGRETHADYVKRKGLQGDVVFDMVALCVAYNESGY